MKSASKYLSLVLRHNPDGIAPMDEHGWVPMAWFCQPDHGSLVPPIVYTEAILAELAAASDKNRFEISETRIRARQGHSVDVNINPVLVSLASLSSVIYHGTAESNVPAILEHGLKTMGRNYVHLSRNIETAKAVGSRHGKPVVLAINAHELALRHGLWEASNGVLLAGSVPAHLIRILNKDGNA